MDELILEKNKTFTDFFILTKIELRKKKDGNSFLSLELQRNSRAYTAMIWENADKYEQELTENSLVKLQGVAEEYQGKFQIKVTKIRAAISDDKVDIFDLMPKSIRSKDEMRIEFLARIDKIKNKHLNLLLKSIFSSDTLEKYLTAPAGKAWHHAYISGLVEHTLEIIKFCDLAADFHPEVNRDLLISGAMLHDFGKLQEISSQAGFNYTTRGKLIGHIVLCAMYVDKKIQEISGFPEELRDCLIHLILSHQGKFEFQSPVVPKILEAIILYQADELSAKTNAYKNAIKNNAGQNNWTKNVFLADTDLYKHNLENE